MQRIVTWWDARQIPLYIAGIFVGGALGLLVPSLSPAFAAATMPVLALLLFVTFLGMPLVELGRSFTDIRFLGAVLALNFLFVPIVAFGLSRFVADDRALLIGVLLVLLTPCVDYVIVFTGIAGGSKARLLAATPLLMMLQIVLLPVYVWLFAGAETVQFIEPAPFAEAFLVIVLLPLVAAASVQAVARRHSGVRRVQRGAAGAMVPLMMLTFVAVIGSQIAAAGGEAVTLLRVVPLYVAFLAIMLVAGAAAARVARLTVPDARALVFSGATRNSLVVLPLALALPAELAIAPLAVVTQTLIELVGMLVFVRVVPKVVPARLKQQL